MSPRENWSRLSATRIAFFRTLLALTTNMVAEQALESNCASAKPITGGPSMTIRPKTSIPTARRDRNLGPDRRSAALGGSGPDGMKVKLGMKVLWKVSGAVHLTGGWLFG